ncbi:MAG: S41 family peptidase [Candidatus Eisenbacteria bacterium]
MRTLLPTLVMALLAVAALVTAVPDAAAQNLFARPGELPKIDARTQAAIVDSVTTAIDTIYVIKETADRIIAHLREQLAAGAYKELTDPVLLAQRLDADARTIYNDHHFGIAALKPYDAAVEGAPGDPQDSERAQRSLRAQNFGFKKVEILPGNIGYLEFDRFAPTEVAGETAAAAMNFLANTHALIIDLRQNGGGNASMIRLLAGYLFAEQQHLINWYVRDTDETVQSHSLDFVPGKRMADIPVYVLTSDFTGSAAEEFTFDLKHLERATIVGDTTGGGGHTVATSTMTFKGFRIGMRIPYGRAYDPKTGQGWEGVGVIPDVAVPSAQALTVAHAAALARLEDEVEDEQTRFELAWARQDLEGKLHPLELTLDQLSECVGTFGPRRIFIEGGRLQYQREGRPQLALQPLGADLFRVGDLDYFRLRFERDASGKVVRLVGLYSDGREEANDRS